MRGTEGRGHPVVKTNEELLFVLSDQRLGTTEVADKLDCHRDTAKRRLKQLEKQGLVTSEHIGGTLLWERATEPHLFVIQIGTDQTQLFREGVQNTIPVHRDGIPQSIIPKQLAGMTHPRAWPLNEADCLEYHEQWDAITPGDIILFRDGEEIVFEANAVRKCDDPTVADYLWPEQIGNTETTYPWTLLLSDGTERAIDVTELLGQPTTPPEQGTRLHQIPDSRTTELRRYYGSLTRALHALDRFDEDPPQILLEETAETAELVQTDEPLISAAAGSGKTLRMMRALVAKRNRDVIRDQYEGHCAFCGTRPLTPDSESAIDVIHIGPEPDDEGTPQNAITACKRDHWGFDNGWLAIDDDYTILARRPAADIELEGFQEYHDFQALAGTHIQLPEDEAYYPSQDALRTHRNSFGEHVTWDPVDHD